VIGISSLERAVLILMFVLVSGFAKEQGGMSTEVIRRAFGAAEEDFHQQVRQAWLKRPKMAAVGSCCLLGAISGDTLYVANLGDSRAVLGRRVVGGGVAVAERLSSEHNAASEEVRRELTALNPDDAQIVVHARGTWRVKGIIQVRARSANHSLFDLMHYRVDFREKHGCLCLAMHQLGCLLVWLFKNFGWFVCKIWYNKQALQVCNNDRYCITVT
jgi:hypothetical protein